jgi:hypothetical protein
MRRRRLRWSLHTFSDMPWFVVAKIAAACFVSVTCMRKRKDPAPSVLAMASSASRHGSCLRAEIVGDGGGRSLNAQENCPENGQ